MEPGARGARPFLTASWRHLAMLNYEADPDLLRGLVPPGTELDRWNGRTFISIVGFRFLDTRLLGLAIPFHRDFTEVNLRFYVRRRAGDEWRRRVVFVRELVPKRVVSWIARAFYHEPYLTVPMQHAVDADRGRLTYRWKLAGRWHQIAMEAEGRPALPPAGSQEEFITEHYWGYTAQPDGGCREYRVEHPRWTVRAAATASLEADVGRLYGPALAEPLSRPPVSAFAADGSGVRVYRGVLLPGRSASPLPRRSPRAEGP